MNRGRTWLVATLSVLVPITASVAVLQGAKHYWRSSTIQSVSEQVSPLHLDHSAGCDRPLQLGESSTDCLWNADGKGKPYYLVGDSKMGQWAEAGVIGGSLGDHPVYLSKDNGCPFFTGSFTIAGIEQSSCTDSSEQTLKALTQAKPGVVFISVAGSYLMGDNFGLGAPGQPSASTDPAQRTEANLQTRRQQIEQLQKSGHEVTLVQENVDYPGWNPAGCPMLKALSNPENCGLTVSRSAAEAEREPLAGINARLSQETGAELVEPLPHLCNDQTCATQAKEFWRSRDASHITVGQSRILWPLFYGFGDEGPAKQSGQ